MSKLLAVVGATGTQGHSVIDAALKDGKYRIRSITRNPSSEKATALSALGVESEVTGKRAVYVQTSMADYSMIWTGWAEEMGLTLQF
ncbi:hypothetical protein AWENTII_002367 [Aspergillus wentii]|nr:hypothetical protein MW887_008043 [Aspergillus wentii]